MDVRRLEAFCKVYELKSFSRAGQDLYLSQPTISAHVSALEQELGMPLFDRLGRTVISTQAGEILYQYAQEAFACLKNAKTEIQLLQERVAGEITVGGSTIPSHYLLPPIMAKFSARYPDVRINLRVGDTQQVIENVMEGDLILGIVGDRDDHPDLVFSPLLQDELVIVASPRMPNARMGLPIGTKEICTWPWIMREKGSGTRRAFEKGLLSIGLDVRCLNTAVTVQSTEAVLQCVRAGLGLSVTSRIAAEAHIASGELIEIAVPALQMPRYFFFVYHQRRHFFPVFRYFIEFLEKERDFWSQERKQAEQRKTSAIR